MLDFYIRTRSYLLDASLSVSLLSVTCWLLFHHVFNYAHPIYAAFLDIFACLKIGLFVIC